MTPTSPLKSTSELSLVEAIPPPPLGPNRKKGLIALKRCCAAWKRAYDAYMEGKDGSAMTMFFAADDAGPAFCKAMPPLVGYENICDFIACVAHGILINAIPEKRANQLLYAAQVALVSLNYEPKPRKSVNGRAHP